MAAATPSVALAKPASSGAHHTVSLHPLSWGRCLPKLAPLAFTAWTVGVPNMAALTGPRSPPSATQWNHLSKAKPASVQPHPISAPCAVPAAIAPILAWLPHPQSGKSYATRQPGAERERWPTWRWPVVISVKADHQRGSQPSSSTRILCLLEDNNYNDYYAICWRIRLFRAARLLPAHTKTQQTPRRLSNIARSMATSTTCLGKAASKVPAHNTCCRSSWWETPIRVETEERTGLTLAGLLAIT